MLNRLVLVIVFSLNFVGCAKEPKPAGKMVGERMQFEIPLANGLDDKSVAMMTMRDVKTQVYKYMNEDNKAAANLLTVLVSDPAGKGYTLGFDFDMNELTHIDFSSDMPYQKLMQLATVDKKMQNGRQIISAWCADTKNNTQAPNICT